MQDSRGVLLEGMVSSLVTRSNVETKMTHLSPNTQIHISHQTWMFHGCACSSICDYSILVHIASNVVEPGPHCT